MSRIKEISPATLEQAQLLAALLEQAQLLANELIANDELKVLKYETEKIAIDYVLMDLKYKVLEYRQDIQDAMAHKF